MRTQTQVNTKNTVKIYEIIIFVSFPRNIKVNKKDIKIILAYSAIKIKANPTAPYSTLNPDTSSDSPSAKSKGVRLVSAKQEISHMPTKGKKTKSFVQNSFCWAKLTKSIVFVRQI